MSNLIIGLLVGMAACVALLVMWRMAESLRRRLEVQQDEAPEKPRP